MWLELISFFLFFILIFIPFVMAHGRHGKSRLFCGGYKSMVKEAFLVHAQLSAPLLG